MASDNKRKDPVQEKSKKPRPLIKLNGEPNERYDSYGYKIEPPKPPAAPSYKAPAPAVPERKRTVQENGRSQKASAPRTAPERKKSAPNNKAAAGKQHRKTEQSSAKKTQKPRTTDRKERSLYGNGSSKSGDRAPAHERRISERSIKRRKVLITAGKVCIFVLLAVCIIALILHEKAEDGNTPRTAFVSTGTIEHSFGANVNFVRDENIVYAGFSGKLIPAVNEGDRVAAGNVIAYIVKSGYENDLKTLRNINNKISAAQNASSYVGASQNTEIAGMNENIKELTDKLSSMSGAASNMKEYTDTMSELDSVFSLKHEILVNTGTADEYINGLKNEREAVLARLDSSMYEIKAEHAGIVSFYVDTTAQNASDKAGAISSYIDKKGETGNMLSETALSFESTQMKSMLNKEVSESDAVARITPDVTYYMTADITGIDYSGLNAGKKIMIKGAGREFTAEATVEEILKYGDKQYLLMKSSSGMSGAISQRAVQSDIVINYSEGIKVPKRALTDWDSAGLTARITIVRSNYVSYVFVNVLAEDSEYAIISNSNSFGTEDANEISTVRINDLYVVNYEVVSNGQILGD